MSIETINHNGFTIRIEPDENPEDPREWDNLGTMVCGHRRYNLGDEQIDGHVFRHIECNTWADVLKVIQMDENPAVVLPIYMLDHSGLRFSTGDLLGLDPFRHFYYGMDSGQVGFIFISREKVKEEFGWKRLTPKRIEKLAGYLKAEVETYDQYHSGDVYGYIIEDSDGNEVDSCWGFYGQRYCIEAAKEACPEPEPVKVSEEKWYDNLADEDWMEE
jgi:hypothetical protein